MKFQKKAGRFLAGLLLLLLCSVTGILSGCDVVYDVLSELETADFAVETNFADETNLASETNATDESSSIEESKIANSTFYKETSSAVETSSGKESLEQTAAQSNPEESISEDGSYTSPEEVAQYLHLYGHLPSNYLTKKEAQEIGWDSSKGNLWEVADGMSIGGSRFGNYEGALPDKSGRKWYECDVNYKGGYRGSERLLYSNDGLIYYTVDHYKTFEQLY